MNKYDLILTTIILAVVLVVSWIFFGLYLNTEYRAFEDIRGEGEDQKMLIKCPDGFSRWYDIPDCTEEDDGKFRVEE